MANFFSRAALGAGIGQVGHLLHLPELGISENIAGGNYSAAGGGIGPTPVIGGQQAQPQQSSQGQVAQGQIPEWQLLGYPNEQAYQQDFVNSGQVAASAGQAPAGPAPTPGGVGYQPQYQVINGQQFDVNDPSQRQHFLQVQDQLLQSQLGQGVDSYNQQTQSALGQANNTYSNQLSGLNLDLQNLGQTKQDYEKQYNRNIYDTNNNYDTGTVNRASYFNNLSPNAYQSSQGTSQSFANDQRLQALGDLQTANDQSQQQFGQQETGLNNQRGQLENSYNDYIKNTQQAAQNYRTQLNNQYNQQKDQLGATSLNANAAQGVSGFDFNRQGYQPTQGVQADISKYTPFLNFNQLAASPGANIYSAAAAPAQSGTAKDNYLGYQPSTQDKSYLNQYLSRGF